VIFQANNFVAETKFTKRIPGFHLRGGGTGGAKGTLAPPLLGGLASQRGLLPPTFYGLSFT